MLPGFCGIARVSLSFFVALMACACGTEVSIQLQRDGPLSLMTGEALMANYPVGGLPEEFNALKTDVESQEVGTPPDPRIPKVYLVVPIEADRALWHTGQYTVRVSPDIYRCDRAGRVAVMRVFERMTEVVGSGYHYNLIGYLPFLVDDAYGAKITAPPGDVCLHIDVRYPNKDTYDGSAHYTSNELRIPADEFAALLGSSIDPVPAANSSAPNTTQ